MNVYQQKWLEMLQRARIQGWTIKAAGDDIYIDMPNVTDLKVIRDNLPQTLGALSLSITVPKTRLKIICHNGHETFDYILNPEEKDLNEE